MLKKFNFATIIIDIYVLKKGGMVYLYCTKIFLCNRLITRCHSNKQYYEILPKNRRHLIEKKKIPAHGILTKLDFPNLKFPPCSFSCSLVVSFLLLS